MRTIFKWRSALVTVAALFMLGLAHSQTVGTIIQTQGDARVAGSLAKAGDSVQAGQPLATGPNAYIYIKTIDGGFLILRPGSLAQVIAYTVDPAQPANSRFKIELQSGVARSISGDAVKKSRENFRFNTPVAAIGVRGTDFTVYTDSQTTRVSVVSGGIVVSGFGAGCGPEGGGPCEGAAKRELYASQTLQVVQVNRGQALPQILRSNSLAPDATAPPRADEPAKALSGSSVGTSVGVSAPLVASATSPDLAPRKTAVLETPAPVVPPPVVITPPVVVPSLVVEVPVVVVPPVLVAPVVVAPPVVVALPVVAPPVVEAQPVVVEPPVVVIVTPPAVIAPVVPPLPALVWGRWQALADQSAEVSLTDLKANNQLLALNSFYALGRNKDNLWQAPSSGAVSFSLQSSQALVQSDAGSVTAASLENGRLNVNFSSSTFTTQFDLLTQGKRLSRMAEGNVFNDGTFANASQFLGANNMLVQGVLASSPVLQAGYVFQSRIDSGNVAYGITQWGK
jgi:hypothetical protein